MVDQGLLEEAQDIENAAVPRIVVVKILDAPAQQLVQNCLPDGGTPFDDEMLKRFFGDRLPKLRPAMVVSVMQTHCLNGRAGQKFQ